MYGQAVTQHPSTSEAKTSPFQQVADALRAEIVDGRISVGDQLPTQQELRARFKVSRATIQRALGELKSARYIDSHQGQGSWVIDWRASAQAANNGTAYHPDLAAVTLPKALEEAFASPEVTIDAFCFTAETLAQALAPSLAGIRSGEHRPRSITLRLLLPSLDAHLGLPRSVDDPKDARPLDRLRQIVKSSAYGVISTVRSLQMEGLVPSVDAQAKEVPITPTEKLYLLNHREVLKGYYVVEQRSIPLPAKDGGDEDVAVYDILGLSATLFRHVATSPGIQGTMIVEASRVWFDSLWSTIARDSPAVPRLQ